MINWFEIRYALRSLAKSPGHSALSTILIALSLSVGLVAATLAYGLVFAPLDLPNSDRWYYVAGGPGEEADPIGIDTIDVAHYRFLQQHQTTFETFGALNAKRLVKVSDENLTRRISIGEVSPNIFAAAEFEPMFGRSFQTEESDSNVVISQSFWQNFFSSDPNIIGRQFRLDQQTATVIGVVPEDTVFGTEYNAWLAQDWTTLEEEAAANRGLAPIGILKTGITLEQAQQELTNLTREFQQQNPLAYGGEVWAIELRQFKYFLTNFSTPIVLAFTIVASIVVVLGCINIVNLFVARSFERQQELAVRNSLGASSFKLFKQCLLESFLICISGLIASLPILLAVMSGVNAYLQGIGSQFFLNYGASLNTPTHWQLGFNLTFFVAALFITGFIWMVSAMWPAIRLQKLDAGTVLNNSSAGSTKPGFFTAVRILVGLQILIACFLLIVSTSLNFSVKDTINTDYGIATEQRYVVGIELPETYRGYEQTSSFVETLEEQLRSNTNIRQAAVISGIPYAAGLGTYGVDNNNDKNQAPFPISMFSVFSAEAFDVMGITITEGRQFEVADIQERRPVVIVDEKFALENWPGESAVGKQIRLSPERGGYLVTVVGVASNSVFAVDPSQGRSMNTLFLHRRFLGGNFFEVVLETILPVADNSLLDLVSDTVSAIDPNVAVFGPRSMQAHLESKFSLYKLVANLFLAVGLATILLAGIGIYAMTARSVVQQTHHIGIRRALGSTKVKVLLVYLKQSVIYLTFGSVLGGGLAILANLQLADKFANLLNFTPAAFGVVLAGISLLALYGTLYPTLRALREEPGNALRQV